MTALLRPVDDEPEDGGRPALRLVPPLPEVADPADARIRVLSGNPTPEELAAVLAVLAAVGSAAAPEQDDVPAARWLRLERHSGFDGPRSWHAGRCGGRSRVLTAG